MLNYVKALFFFLVWAAIAITSHQFIFSNCSISNISNVVNGKKIKLKQLVVYKGTDSLFIYEKGITIKKNSTEIEKTSNFNQIKIDLTKYLTLNYDKQLQIIGLFNNSENDLGLGRSKNFKVAINYNNSKQIDVLSQMKPFSFDRNEMYSNGIRLRIINAPNSYIDSLENSIKNKRIYTSIENKQLINTDNLIKYSAYLKRYIQRYPNKTITITGHTDNKGFYQKNLIKGREKATILMAYFISQGVNSENIIANSRGEAEPIANKYTEEGRKLNNRIEIKIN